MVISKEFRVLRVGRQHAIHTHTMIDEGADPQASIVLPLSLLQPMHPPPRPHCYSPCTLHNATARAPDTAPTMLQPVHPPPRPCPCTRHHAHTDPLICSPPYAPPPSRTNLHVALIYLCLRLVVGSGAQLVRQAVLLWRWAARGLPSAPRIQQEQQAQGQAGHIPYQAG